MDMLETTTDHIDDGSDAELLDEQVRLGFLRREREYGYVSFLAWSLKENEKLRHSRFPHIREEFLQIEEEAMRGLEIEKQHGTGSLLNIDHPFVQKLAKGGAPEGGPIIPASLVAVAQAYRATLKLRASD